MLMLLPVRESAMSKQQDAETPQQRDRHFACFFHLRTPAGKLVVLDTSVRGPERQSASCLHSAHRFVDARPERHVFSRQTLSHHRAQSKLFACISSGGVPCPVWSSAA